MLEKANSTLRRAYSVQEVSDQTTLSVPYLRSRIRAGNLKAKKVGRRVLILDGDLQSFLEGLEDWKTVNSNGGNHNGEKK